MVAKTNWDSEPLVVDHVWFIIELIRYGYSGMTRCPGRGQATLAEGPNPPGHDFVNALVDRPVPYPTAPDTDHSHNMPIDA